MVIPKALSQTILVVTVIVAGGFDTYSAAEPEETKLAETSTQLAKSHIDLLRDQRRQFQNQDLITATPNTWIFNPGNPPRIIWRDVDEARRLGFKEPLRVRWFNAQLEEVALPNESGRWIAWIDGTAPNGLPFRRALTFHARPKNFLLFFAPDLSVRLPYFPGPINADVWQEHEAETGRLAANGLLRTLNDSENGAILLSGLLESKPFGRPVRLVDSVSVLNQDYHLALKLKVEGLRDRVRTLQLPCHRTKPVATVHQGSSQEAGIAHDAKAKIDAVCHAWADDTGEPFVVLVARNGVIVTHEAFGRESNSKSIGTNYRCWVGSITKSVTALLFSQFVDQSLISLDDSLAAVFPDYPKNDTHVPTFRQCFNHTSGLSGHGDFGGANNSHLENIVLNAIDINEPGVRYSYSGMGYDLAAKAMEIVAGRSFVRLYDEYLFRPLNFGDVPIDNASSEGRFTAMELGILAQLVANRGSYGDLQFISPKTFDRLLPERLHVAEPGAVEDEGIGLHWIRRPKANAAPNSIRPDDQMFSQRTVGHGSLSGCIFMIDLDQQLVVAQVRRQSGPRYAEWSAKFFQTVADAVLDGKAGVSEIAKK